jgi:ferrous iron transport protein A
MTLAELEIDREGRIARLTLAPETAAYLRAVGFEEGIGVRVIRRAAFGGPLLVRTSSGADVALDPELARGVEIETVELA